MNSQRTFRGMIFLLFAIFMVLITQTSWSSTRTTTAAGPINLNVNVPSGANILNSGGDPVHVLIPSNKFDRATCRSLFSHWVNGFPPPRILMYDLKADWATFTTQKIPAFHDYLKTAKDGTIIILIDGTDLWSQLPLEVMLDRYQRMTKNNKTALVSADKVCWPNARDQPVCTDVPQSTLPDDVWGEGTGKSDPQTRPRWNNSGGIIGEASILRKMFEELRKGLDARAQPPWSEQEVFNDVYAELWKNPHNSTPWHLDFESNIFQTLVQAERDISFQWNIDPRTEPTTETKKVFQRTLDLQGLDMEGVWKDRPLVWNQISNTVPVILHLNGWSKQLMTPFWKRMWFYKDGPKLMEKMLSQPDEAGVWMGNEWKTYNGICSQHLKRIWED